MKNATLIILAILTSLTICAQDIDKKEEEISKQFLEHLKKSQFESALKLCDTSFTNKIDVEGLSQTWAKLQEQLGDFKECIGIETKLSGEYKATFQTFKFERITLDFKLTFNSQNLIVGMFMVPHVPKNLYQPPYYVKLNMFFETKVNVKTEKFVLPGILTIPIAGNKFPVVILVHGSGPQDKDESVGPNKPFEDLAYGLANKGIAVLRYDKRTKVYGAKSAEDINTATVKEEVLDDVSSAIQLVKGIKEIDANNIYVIGHSLGAMLAPRIAKLNHSLKGIVMMSGPARAFEDVLLEQIIYLSDSTLSQKEKREIDSIKINIEKVKRNSFSKKSSENLMGLSASYWLDLNNYHQTEVAKKLNCKILVLQGERDYQVPLKDFDIWKKELSNNKNVEFHSYPKLNHLFLEGEGKSLPAEYNTPENIPEYVINDIVKWVVK